MRRLLLLLLAALTALLASAAPVHAQVDEIVAALREDPLYVSPDSTVTPDQAAVRAALDDLRVPVHVAVLPQSAVDGEELGIDGLSLRLLEGLGDPEAVVVVVTDGQELQAVDGGQAGVAAGAVLDQVLASRLDEPFGPATLTGALIDVAELVDAGASPAAPAVPPRSTRRTIGLVGLVAVAVLGGGGWLYLRAQRRALDEAPLTRDDLDPQQPGWAGVPDR